LIISPPTGIVGALVDLPLLLGKPTKRLPTGGMALIDKDQAICSKKIKIYLSLWFIF